MLCYLYTDEIPPIAADKCLNLLELANRLCLPRLLNLIECRVIEDLTIISQNETNETVDHCLKLLEPVKVRYLFVLLFFFNIIIGVVHYIITSLILFPVT